MTWKGGRARDTVPQKRNKTSRRATKSDSLGSSPPVTPVVRAALAPRNTLDSDVFGLGPAIVRGNDVSSLPLPFELWVRILQYGEVVDLCRFQELARSAHDVHEENTVELWFKLCVQHFPAMCRSVLADQPTHDEDPPSVSPISKSSSLPVAVLPDLDARVAPIPATVASTSATSTGTIGHPPDWKILFARRWQKQRMWDAARGRTRTSSEGNIGGCTIPCKSCSKCGEQFTPGKSANACVSHPGDFMPQNQQGWGRSELRQLQGFARAAWRSVGGTSGVQNHARNFKGGGYWAKGLGFKGWGSRGHWAEGLGARPGPGVLRECIDGSVPCAWTCCGSQVLISEGCTAGVHK